MDEELVYRGIHRMSPLLDIADQEWNTDELLADDFQSFPDGIFRDCDEFDRSGANLFSAIEAVSSFPSGYKNSLLEMCHSKHSTAASALLPISYKKRFSGNIPHSMSALSEEKDASELGFMLDPPAPPPTLPPFELVKGATTQNDTTTESAL